MKTIVLNNKDKKIEFQYFLNRQGTFTKETSSNVLAGALEITLVSENRFILGNRFDFIFVKYEKGGLWEDTFFLGKWNDGVI